MVVHQLDVYDMPLRTAVNVIWYYLTKGATKESVDKLKTDLMRPLPGMTEAVSDEVVSHERELFTKSLAKFGKG